MPDRIAQLERLLEAEPNDAFCLYGLAQEYAGRDEFDRAIEYYDRAIAAEADMCYAFYHKARALEELGRTDEAIAALRAGLARADASGDAHAAAEITALLEELS